MITNSNWGKRHTIMLVLIILVGLFYFEFVGQIGAIEFDDSAAYLAPNIWQGIMPVYHIFIKINQWLWGELYLQGTAIIQGFIAVFCTCLFTYYITKLFCIHYLEMPIIWVLTIIPFSVEMPLYVNTHVIYTEAIAYSLYYIFIIISFNFLISQKHIVTNYICTLLFSIFMALLRPQLLLLLILSGLIAAIKVKWAKQHLFTVLFYKLTLLIGTIVIGVVVTYSVRDCYLRFADNLFSRTEEISAEEEYNKTNNENGMAIGSFDVTNDNDDEAKRSSDEYLNQKSDDQIARMIFMRGMYLADEEDVRLFSKKPVISYYKLVWNELDKNYLLYKYNPGGLYGWEHIADTRIYDTSLSAVHEGSMDSSEEGYIWENINSVLIELGIREILCHPFRFAYYSFILSVPGFISTVFFNIKKYYILCHFYTMLIYLFGVITGIILLGKKNSSNRRDAGLFITYCIMCNCIFVAIVNLVFFSMQRYFLYVFGAFYCALYIGVRALIIQSKSKY